MGKITYIDEANIEKKRVLFRADFDVSLNDNYTIADDARIQHQLPSIKLLLEHHNRLICVAKLGRPKDHDPKLSMRVVVDRLQKYLPDVKVVLIKDFLTEDKKTFENQKDTELFVLENIRYYPQEKQNDPEFAKALASLADVYVNDGFAVCHRTEASVVGVPQYLPSYGGLCLKREITMISKAIENPAKPFVAILGGAKISTKITLINRLIEIADYVLLGGGLANPFFRAKRQSIGNSICEYEMVQKARQILYNAQSKNTSIVLPTDVLAGKADDQNAGGKIFRIGEEIPDDLAILDIGPETKARFGAIIAKAKTIVWNGPVGLFENPNYRQGTDFIYYAIAHNEGVTSIVGGGDTLSAISKKEYLDKITHISTGGGAMLELIENGTLPGIEALKK